MPGTGDGGDRPLAWNRWAKKPSSTEAWAALDKQLRWKETKNQEVLKRIDTSEGKSFVRNFLLFLYRFFPTGVLLNTHRTAYAKTLEDLQVDKDLSDMANTCKTLADPSDAAFIA